MIPIQQQLPRFHHEGKVSFQERSNVKPDPNKDLYQA